MIDLKSYPLEQRQRWFAEMNCWRIPANFPIALTDFTGREREQPNDPQWRDAWNAINDSLTSEESSLGWWLYELGKTEDEWRLWWNGRKRRMNVGNMAEALKARDEGIASSANHAETDAPGWGERAYQAVKQWMDWDCDWTIEEARMVSHAMGLDYPMELRAWGSVTQRLIRDGIIEPVGYARAASSNGSPKRTYRLVR